MILENIPVEEQNEINNGIKRSIKSFYSYRNSILGILDAISQDYSDTSFDLENIQKLLNNVDLSTLKDIAPLLDTQA